MRLVAPPGAEPIPDLKQPVRAATLGGVGTGPEVYLIAVSADRKSVDGELALTQKLTRCRPGQGSNSARTAGAPSWRCSSSQSVRS